MLMRLVLFIPLMCISLAGVLAGIRLCIWMMLRLCPALLFAYVEALAQLVLD